MVTLSVEVTFDVEVLGTASANPALHEEYIASKAPDAAKLAEEVANLGADEVFEKGMTIFSKDEHGNPIVYDYQWKGYFKEAFKFLRQIPKSKCSGIKNYKQIIDGLIFPTPRQIIIDTSCAKEDSDICQRPLRASTAQGERVALASSETVPAGSKMNFDIQILNDSFEAPIIEALDYGRLHGFGQWRNSGKGRFHYKITNRVESDNLF